MEPEGHAETANPAQDVHEEDVSVTVVAQGWNVDSITVEPPAENV